MEPLNRRSFLSASLGGTAAVAALTWYSGLADYVAGPHGRLFGLFGYDPSTLFLTWQRDPTTTITVQWLAPETADDKTIYYNLLGSTESASAATITKPYPPTELKVHRCELTGLVPGGEYAFRIGACSPTYRFRTMPAKATQTIQFVTGGDSGVGAPAIATNRLAARQDPQFVLIGGDLAYDNGESPETFTRFLQNYREYVVDSQGRLIPMIACIGNHEVVGGYNAPRRDSPQFLSFFDGLFAERTFGVLDIGDYLSLVLLDTNHIVPVAGEQTDWLERTLADRQERPHLIVANHVPAYPSVRNPEARANGPGAGADQRRLWCPLFERYKVDCVLEHHDHAFKRTHPLADGLRDRNGVLYLGDGSWGHLRSPHSPEERPYLAAVDKAYHLSFHRLEGERQFHVALDDKGKVADVCMTAGKRPSRRG